MNMIWLPPPQQPGLPRGEIHVWFCDFSGISDFGDVHEILSEAEIRRAAQFRSEDARLTFVGAHVFLHRVLGAYLQPSGIQLRFTAENAGKPRLDRAVHSTDLEFNLSHSHRSAICAVTDSVAVGIDMERPDPKLCEIAMAEQVFSSEELRGLRVLELTERSPAFFRCWTKKEAYAKCKGMGLATDLTSMELGLDPGKSKFKNLSLSTFQCPNGYIASLAVEGGLEDVKAWQLEAESLAIL